MGHISQITLVKLNQKSSCPQSSTKRLLRRLHLRLLLKLRPRRKKQKKWPKNKSSKCETLQAAVKSKISWCFYPLSSKTSDHLLKKEIMEENQAKNSFSPKKPTVIMTPTTP